MDIMQAIKERHSVREYTDKRIEGHVEEELRRCISECNESSGLHIQLTLNEPKAFSGMLAHYGSIKNVKSYIALVGPKGSQEKCGYYGEKVVLCAQQLGLNTCWIALTYSKSKSVCDIKPGEKLICVIALGYGATQGVPHKSKDISKVCNTDCEMPTWFRNGMEAALLAPTAMNHQRFVFTLKDNEVTAKALPGSCTKIDLGIAKCHFEIGAGREGQIWNSR